MLTCYLVILPITNGLSHLFSRLYHTIYIAILIATGLVAYKTLIEKKDAPSNTIEEERSENTNVGQKKNAISRRKTILALKVDQEIDVYI